jgi:prepilin-type processing-associated H-X9-DG protein
MIDDRHAPGLRLVDVLVVLAVVAVLILVLVPAIQTARETARRNACAKNLQQIGLALANYHNSMKTFPPGCRRGPPGYGWVPRVLPYLGQQSLYDRYRWDRDWLSEENQSVIRVPLRVVLCASTPGPVNRTYKLLGGQTAAVSDYAGAGFAFSGIASAGLIPTPLDFSGVLRCLHTVRYTDIRDGRSNTLLIVEDAGRPRYWTAGVPGPDSNDPGCFEGGVITGGRVGNGAWAAPHTMLFHGFSFDGLRCTGPCAINCTNSSEPYSFHPGGVNVAFADGSVRFLAEAISIKTFAALFTRAGGEVVTDGDF